MLDVDVAIAGGGPAGSILALRLARLGHSVAVIERSAFDRPRVGESLSRGVWPLFDILGLLPDVLRAGFLPIDRALIKWETDAIEERHQPPTLAVDRPRFDALLLDIARRAGAVVLQPFVAPAPHREGDRWIIGDVRARFIADATGRASWLHSPRRRVSEPLVATFAQWTGPREPRVEAMERGWLWGSPLPNGAYSAIAFTRDGRDYREMIAESELFRELQSCGKVRTCDATSYATVTPATATSICVGEASYSIDPLSSSGVQAAMQSAIHASIVVNTILRRPPDTETAIRFYAEAQAAAVARHAMWTAEAYANSRWRNAAFWRGRVAAPLDESPRSTDIRAIGDFVTVDLMA